MPGQMREGSTSLVEQMASGRIDRQTDLLALLVVQSAVGPFDHPFEASRGEMRGCDINGVEKGIRIERAQTAARSMASIAASGWLRAAWINPLADHA
jgi:hypothetical protein